MKITKKILSTALICAAFVTPVIAEAGVGYYHSVYANYNNVHARADTNGSHGLVTEAYLSGHGSSKDSGYYWAQSTIGNRGRAGYARVGKNYTYEYRAGYYM